MKEDVRRIVAEFAARDKSAGAIMGFEKRMTNLSKTLLRMAGVGGGLYAFKRIIIDNVKEQSVFIDSTAKMADRLNITTEALVGLQHGAKISGVETGTLNKSLEIFSRRLGEVDMGVGQAKYALEELGLKYEDLIGLNMDDAFSVVADQINKLSTQSEKAAAANYLFGRSGQQLLNLFAKGSAGIKDFRKEAKELGLTFNRLDAAKVEEANDAITRMKSSTTGLANELTITLAPAIEKIANSLTKFITKDIGNMEVAMRTGLAMIYDTADAATNLDELFVKISPEKWTKTYKQMADEQREIIQNILTGKRELESAAVMGPQQSLGPANKLSVIDYESSAYATDGANATDYVTSARATSEQARKQLIEANKLLEERREKAQKFASRRAEITARMYDDMGIHDKRYTAAQEALLKIQKEDYSKFIKDKALLDEWYESRKAQLQQNAIDRWSQTYGNMDNLMESLAEDYTSGLESLSSYLTKWQRGEEVSWREWGDSLVMAWQDSLNKMALAKIQQKVMDPWIDAALGAVGSMFGNYTPKTKSGATGNSSALGIGQVNEVTGMGWAKGGIFDSGKVVPFANGGIVDAPTLFPMANGAGLMGESGPEAIMPLKRGSNGKLGVVTNSQNTSPKIEAILVYDMEAAMDRYLKSDKSTKPIIVKVANNKKLMN